MRQVPLHPFLFLVLECDHPIAGGARYPLHGVSSVVLGRAEQRGVARTGPPNAMLRIGLSGRSVSTRHAEIRVANGQWTLDDLGSTNGTFVNGQPVKSVQLSDGDLIEIGHTYLLFAKSVPDPAAEDTSACEYTAAPNDVPAPFATLLPWLDAVFEKVRATVRTGLTFSIIGTTGTGKEVVARAIHEMSGRTGPLVPVNCGAMAPALVHSLLFGHIKGAFSGAVRDEPGFIRTANGGTLFLDEIAELPLEAQAMLLRVIQEREVVPVGASRAVGIDVRYVVAGQTPLPTLVKQGKFRVDLHARLQGVDILLPTLQDRRADFGLLVRSLLLKMGASSLTFSRRAGLALLSHNWPQNIRELEQTLRYSLAIAEKAHVRRVDLPSLVGSAAARDKPGESRSRPHGASTLSDEDRELSLRLLALLKEHRGNVSAVAREMGKDRKQIHRWMQRFGLRGESFD